MCLGEGKRYKVQLLEAGIGEKKITFEKKGSCSYFHDKLLATFPKLQDRGGYELLRTQYRSTTKLEILSPRAAAGYNVFDLKEAVASAKIYVRPLQKDLDLKSLKVKQLSLVSLNLPYINKETFH